ncbi:hypothetical protein GCM10022419_033780 [Nonomuraea rosea]|uniref:DUF4229 domain-containing protein n=1 Tax=Nonomuraea rosea TaxID=638574 RepID=A0ABP6WI23_9ACTN
MLDNLLEGLGFCLLIAFAWFVWPPAALLVAGVGLLVVANVRSGRKAQAKGPAVPGRVERLVRVWLASKGSQP